MATALSSHGEISRAKEGKAKGSQGTQDRLVLFHQQLTTGPARLRSMMRTAQEGILTFSPSS